MCALKCVRNNLDVNLAGEARSLHFDLGCTWSVSQDVSKNEQVVMQTSKLILDLRNSREVNRNHTMTGRSFLDTSWSIQNRELHCRRNVCVLSRSVVQPFQAVSTRVRNPVMIPDPKVYSVIFCAGLSHHKMCRV